MHKIILSTIDDEEAGNYRRVNVRIVGAHHILPQSIKVPRLMEELIEWYYENSRKISIDELVSDDKWISAGNNIESG